MIDYIGVISTNSNPIKLNGRYMNFIDYSHHLHNSGIVKTHLLVGTPNLIKRCFDLFYQPSLSTVRNTDRSIYSIKSLSGFRGSGDILICDFADLCLLVSNNIPIDYNRILVFDCLELTVLLRTDKPNTIITDTHNTDKILRYINDNDVTLLITDYNKLDVDRHGIRYLLYYKKINFDLFDVEYINSIDRQDGLCFYYAKENRYSPLFVDYISSIRHKYPEAIVTDNFMDMWRYKNILYTQKPYVGFVEQFGRIVFEMQRFGYNVIIDNTFKSEDKTGLDYYMDHYNGLIPNLTDEDTLSLIK